MTRRLYGIPLSGHVHRVRLFLSILKLDYDFVEASMQSPEVLRLNPLGQIPVFEDGDIILTDSNAILVYLAKTYAPDSHWLPEDPLGAAHVQKWFSIAAGELRYGPAIARAATIWKRPEEIAPAQAKAGKLLPFMESELANRSFLAGNQPTLADRSSDESCIYQSLFPKSNQDSALPSAKLSRVHRVTYRPARSACYPTRPLEKQNGPELECPPAQDCILAKVAMTT